MPRLQPPESHYVNAALGWLELGNSREALAELERLPAALRECAEALLVRWEIEAKGKDWEQALQTARGVIAQASDQPEGWIKQSYALHELRRTREAWESLLSVAVRFPTLCILPYNLACYACQLGDQAEALRRLSQAIQLGGKDHIKPMALRDADLEPLWDRIRVL